MPLEKLITIVAQSSVEWLLERRCPMSQARFRFYPDGSLWTDDLQGFWSKHQTSLGTSSPLHGRGNSDFRPLAPFMGNQYYLILYPGTCDWMGEHESWAVTYPGVAKPVSEDEYDLEHVRVLIHLRLRFTEAVARELANALRDWFMAIGSKGVFGESGVVSISPAMRYLGKDAAFELDARGSGQETLNTLYLAVLNWGIAKHRTLSLTDLAADRHEAVFTSDLSVPLG